MNVKSKNGFLGFIYLYMTPSPFFPLIPRIPKKAGSVDKIDAEEMQDQTAEDEIRKRPTGMFVSAVTEREGV